MFVEHLRFRVEPGRAAAFAAHNARWRAALARQAGFIDQQVHRDADDPAAWLVTVRWRDRAAMEGFPPETQVELDAAGRAISTLERAEHYEAVPS